MFEPLPKTPTEGMRGAFTVLLSDERYPLPTGQAALWAVLAGYADDPVEWSNQLLNLTHLLIDEPQLNQ